MRVDVLRQPVRSVGVAQGCAELLEEEGVGYGERGGRRVRLLEWAFVERAARSGDARHAGHFSAAQGAPKESRVLYNHSVPKLKITCLQLKLRGLKLLVPVLGKFWWRVIG